MWSQFRLCCGFALKSLQAKADNKLVQSASFLRVRPRIREVAMRSPNLTCGNPVSQMKTVQVGAGRESVRHAYARGFTLIELIVATAILVILTGLAVPMARVAIKREREHELRQNLWEMRDAIDRYKDAADRGAFQIKVGTEGYPPDLQTLVDGVDVGGKKLRFLRRIPVDSMTGSTDWGLRSMQDDPASDS